MSKKLFYNFRILFFCIIPLVLFYGLCSAKEAVSRENTVQKELGGSTDKTRQIAVFKSEKRAQSLAKKLQKDGMDAYVRKVKSGNKNNMYRVFVKGSGKRAAILGEKPSEENLPDGEKSFRK